MRRVSPVSTRTAYSAGGAPLSVAVIQISLPPGAHARPVAPCAQPRAIETGLADFAIENGDVALAAVRFDECDAAVGRDADVAQRMRRFVADVAERRLDAKRAVAADDRREVRAVGRPIGLQHLLGHFARRAAGERDAGERAEAGQAIAAEQDGELRRFRDRQDVGILHAERPRLGALPVGDENLGRIAVPRRAVDDRIAVRTEARRAHFAAAERHAMKDDLGRRLGLHPIRCEVPAAPRRAGDGNDEEQREQNRRNAARHRLRQRRRPRGGADRRRDRRRHRADCRGRGAPRRIGLDAHRRRLRRDWRRSTTCPVSTSSTSSRG